MNDKTTTQGTKVVTRASYDSHYEAWRGAVMLRFADSMTKGPLFHTQADNLFAIYINALDEQYRQYHTCSACHSFFSHFGDLVVIDESGRTIPALWNPDDAPEMYKRAADILYRAVGKAKVRRPFVSDVGLLGTPVTGEWTHFSANLPADQLWTGKLLTANQKAAERVEDFKNVERALREFSLALLEQAIRVVESDELYRGEKILDPAKWLYDLQKQVSTAKGNRGNLIWRAVALAPPAFCHPRTGMLSTLLADIEAGMDFSLISKRFKDKMHPLLYRRPQVAPSAGNIKVAEATVKKLGIAPSLHRRYARFEEIESIWRPKSAALVELATGGVFGHLKAKDVAQINKVQLPATHMTWVKFREEVLSGASFIELGVPSHGNFTGILTAVHPEAPPIIQWDREDNRNPFSWYLYQNGSSASNWNLDLGGYRKVAAVTLLPCNWKGNTDIAHFGNGLILVLDDCRDLRGANICLFPEILKSELHGIRSVVEAYSASMKAQEKELASACGLLLGKDGWGARLRVNGDREYILDRWD